MQSDHLTLTQGLALHHP